MMYEFGLMMLWLGGVLLVVLGACLAAIVIVSTVQVLGKRTTVKRNKAGFVANELTALLRQVDSKIVRANYRKDPNGEEYVDVHYQNGVVPLVVCVTADSFLEITQDVLREVA